MKSSLGVRGLFLFVLIFAPAFGAQLKEAKYQGRSAWILSNGAIELTLLSLGGSMASIVLQDDSRKINPLWDSLHEDEEAGLPPRKNGEIGHFICLDGFGPPSAEEQAAGLPEHGEAQTLPWKKRSFRTQGALSTLVLAVKLPLVQEKFTRTIELADGENVLLVHSTLESLLAFDRPVFWVEHAAIGSPFLEPGATVVDLSKNRALTRPWKGAQLNNPLHRLAPNREFNWPLAPAANGGTINLRETPEHSELMDQTGHLMDTGKRFAFVTALNVRKHLLLGYVFRPAEYPWLQSWEFYRRNGELTRGLEFGCTVFGRPRRETITANSLFGHLLYRWLPARSSIETTFLMFWTGTPEGFHGVDDIKIEDDRLRVIDRRSNKEIVLKTSVRLSAITSPE